MADGTKNGSNKSIAREPRNQHHPVAPSVVEVPKDKVMEVAARLVCQGYKLPEVARILVDHLVTEEMLDRPLEQKLSSARQKLRRWKYTERFRDLVYNEGLVELDLQSGEMMRGIAKKAKKGRVDAARLAFELTGRHNPKGDPQPTQIAVVVNGVPRPQRRAITDDSVVDVEAVEADE